MTDTTAQRVLIVSVKAGAGHLRAAAALEETLQTSCPGVETKNIEALEFTSKAFRSSFTGMYERLARDLPSVWGYIYETMERKSVDSRVKKLVALSDQFNSRKLWSAVEDFDPDAVVCTHYFPAETIGAKRAKGKLDARVYVTLTDYDIHTMWIQDGVDRYFVATDAMEHALRSKGIGDADVGVTGIPIMPVFAKDFPPRTEMRRRLGLETETPTVLMSAGGFGLSGIDTLVGELADAAESVQILGIAGRNKKLETQLRTAAESRPRRIVPYGFVDNMHELMAASDIVVGKPGGLTSSEALALGCPMVVFNPIPGQEERNADYLLEEGVALRAHSPAELVYKVSRLLADTERLERMRNATARIARPCAARDIVDTVVHLR